MPLGNLELDALNVTCKAKFRLSSLKEFGGETDRVCGRELSQFKLRQRSLLLRQGGNTVIYGFGFPEESITRSQV